MSEFEEEQELVAAKAAPIVPPPALDAGHDDLDEEATAFEAGHDDPTLGSGAPADALDVLGHWAEMEAPAIAPSPNLFQSPVPDAGPGVAFPDVPIMQAETGSGTGSGGPQPKPPVTKPPVAKPPVAKPPVKGGAPVAKAPPTPAPPDPKKEAWKDLDKKRTDPKARKTLGTDWIDGKNMDPHVRESIDRSFGEQTAAKNLKTNPNVAKARRDEAAAVDAKIRDVMKRKKLTKAQAEKDPEVTLVKTGRGIWTGLAEIGAKDEMGQGDVKASRTTPDTQKVNIDQGRTRARDDFMGWAHGLIGNDDEKIKNHYEGIRETRKGSGMFLAADARARWEAAVKAFEAAHPGYTMFDSGSSMELRGHHQAEDGVGMQGHALGEAFDLQAAWNPNINDKRDIKATGFALNKAMLEKFGADPNTPGSRGRALMDREGKTGKATPLETRVETLGKHNAAGAVTTADDATAKQVKDEFNEMVQTSENFKKSLPAANVQALQTTRQTYFDLRKKQDALKKNPKDAALEAEVEKMKKEVAEGMEKALTPWTDKLDDENTAAKAEQAKLNQTATDAHQHQDEVTAAEDAELDEMAADLGLETREKFDKKEAAAQKAGGRRRKKKTYKDSLIDDLKKQEEEAKKDAQKQQDTLNVNAAIADRLTKVDRFYGGVKDQKGDYHQDMTVRDVPLMQLIEHGFVRNDEMPERTKAEIQATGKKQVFNGDVAETLARFGFAPGAAFGDTMHFDFIEGYNNIVEGGRHAKGTFGPEGVKQKK